MKKAKARTEITTVAGIYAAINPLPAALSKKGKVNPSVELQIEANARMEIVMRFKKYGAVSEWDNEYHLFSGDSFAQCLEKAKAFVTALPSAEQAKLHGFMDKLGKLIDVGKSEGIAIDYLNPLVDSMKRLSENVITHQPVKP
jgi:hypothetical protein